MSRMTEGAAPPDGRNRFRYASIEPLREACTVIDDDCPMPAQYRVYLEGLCGDYAECHGHGACERHAQAYRLGQRPIAASRITTLVTR